jgi:hypothetical protein
MLTACGTSGAPAKTSATQPRPESQTTAAATSSGGSGASSERGGSAAPKRKRITGDQKALHSFAVCVRASGVPNFPNPRLSNGEYGFGDLTSEGIDRKSPRVKAALKRCRPLLESAAGAEP